MVARVNKALNWLVLLPLAIYLALHWTLSFDRYYEAGGIEVIQPAVPGEITLAYNGGPKAQFVGSYSVTIRKFETREVACETGSSRFRYTPDSERPDPITMRWWSGGAPACINLAPGIYVMETCWTIHDRLFSLLPPVTGCVKSNRFAVSDGS